MSYGAVRGQGRGRAMMTIGLPPRVPRVVNRRRAGVVVGMTMIGALPPRAPKAHLRVQSLGMGMMIGGSRHMFDCWKIPLIR